LKYFYEYFDYLDFVYSANELQIVINKLNTTIDDNFRKTIYSQLLKDKNYLIDLLGTKYIRENRLTLAEKTFKSLEKKYWDENYNSWERDKYEEYYAFDKNPFYDLKHTESFIPHKDKFIVTKLSVTQHLIKYLKIANNPKNIYRDYYYFLMVLIAI
jgi:aspartyl/asparaginyl beta-hydroxylase (cupin superfamily)